MNLHSPEQFICDSDATDTRHVHVDGLQSVPQLRIDAWYTHQRLGSGPDDLIVQYIRAELVKLADRRGVRPVWVPNDLRNVNPASYSRRSFLAEQISLINAAPKEIIHCGCEHMGE
jgi:hypothetical protein